MTKKEREIEKMKKEVKSLMYKIDKYTQTLNALIKLGWCYNDDIVTYCHNERAILLGKIEQKN